MKISVCITSYNQRAFLIEAIESVLAQTLKPFEIIIADDCSTDGSQEVIAEYARIYPRLMRPILHAKNHGVARTRSAALERARGELVTCLDGDDRFLRSKLERELETLRSHAEARIAFSNVYYIDAAGERKGVWCSGELRPPSGYVFREAFSRDFPRNSLFRNELVDRSCFREVEPYDPTCQPYEDWDMKVRLTHRFAVAFCDQPLTEYRLHPGGVSRSRAYTHLSSMRRVHEKNRHLLEDLPKSDRVRVEHSISAKFAQLARRAALQDIEGGNKKLALKHWLRSSRKGLALGYIAQLVLPRRTFLRLRASYRTIRGVWD